MVDDFEELDVVCKDAHPALKLAELQTIVQMLHEKELGRVAQIQALESKLKEKNETIRYLKWKNQVKLDDAHSGSSPNTTSRALGFQLFCRTNEKEILGSEDYLHQPKGAFARAWKMLSSEERQKYIHQVN